MTAKPALAANSTIDPPAGEDGLTSSGEVNHSLTEKLRALQGDMGIAEFARKCGLGESLMRKYLAGSMPGADNLGKIARANHVTADSLIFDDMYLYSGHLATELKAKDAAADLAMVKQFDVALGGGRGVIPENERVIALRALSREWLLEQFRATEDDLFLASIRGDSQAPVLNDGDIVLIDRRKRSVDVDDIYAVRLDDALYAKNLQRLPGHKIRVWAENEKIAPAFTIDEDEIGSAVSFEVLGQVLWRAGKIRR
jgi:transcriptional regulator with XRE-family HTH domain